MKVKFYELHPRIDTNVSVGITRGLKDMIEVEAARVRTKPGIIARNLLIRGLLASGANVSSLGIVQEGEL